MATVKYKAPLGAIFKEADKAGDKLSTAADTTPVRLATLPHDTLQKQQWDLAVLFVTALQRPLTVEEVLAQVHTLKENLEAASISWQGTVP